MIEEAVKKIKEEMEKNKAPYIQAIGNYVLTQIEINDKAAKEVVEGKKTLKDALKKVKVKARIKAVDGCAVLSDEEVYKLVSEYYGFEAEQKNATKVVINEEVTASGPAKEEEHKNFKVDLKDLLRRNK